MFWFGSLSGKPAPTRQGCTGNISDTAQFPPSQAAVSHKNTNKRVDSIPPQVTPGFALRHIPDGGDRIQKAISVMG